MGDRRFDRAWRQWDEAVRQGRRPSEFLGSLTHETLVELLAASHHGRAMERNLIAVELMNRFLRLEQAVAALSEAAEREAPGRQAAAPPPEALREHIGQVTRLTLSRSRRPGQTDEPEWA